MWKIKLAVISWLFYATFSLPLDIDMAIGYWVVFLVSLGGLYINLKMYAQRETHRLLIRIQLVLASIVFVFHILLWLRLYMDAYKNGIASRLYEIFSTHMLFLNLVWAKGWYWTSTKLVMLDFLPLFLMLIAMMMAKNEMGTKK